MATKYAFQSACDNGVIEFVQLTAAATATDGIDLRTEDKKFLFMNVLFQYVIAGIVTSATVRIEGSLDNVNWFHLHGDDSNLTITADGTYALMFENLGEINFIRFYFVSEAGGTASTIDVKAKVFGLKSPMTEVTV